VLSDLDEVPHGAASLSDDFAELGEPDGIDDGARAEEARAEEARAEEARAEEARAEEARAEEARAEEARADEAEDATLVGVRPEDVERALDGGDLDEAVDSLIADDAVVRFDDRTVDSGEDADEVERGGGSEGPATLDGDIDALLDEEVEALPDGAEPGESAAEAPSALDGAVDALLAEPGEHGDTFSGSLEAAFDGDFGGALMADDEVEDLAPERTSVSAAPMRPFVEEAVRAIRRRDFDELERAIQRAIAEGSDLGAVGRIRAVAELARGDIEAARRNLRGAQQRGRADRAAQARYHLAEALLDLHAGEPVAGIRAGLAALAASRALHDARGEAAALHTLAACYRALGRAGDAARLEAAR
jgi:tetratricopeptide (TPR) repeat protein